MPLFALYLLYTLTLFLALFTGCWIFARRSNNATLVDVCWTLCFIPAVLLMAFLAKDTPFPRRALIVFGALLWAGRLGYYVTKRALGHHPHEDPRYTAMRGDRANPWPYFLLIFQFQAAVAFALCIPFALTFANRAPSLHPLEIVGLILLVMAVAGEALADRQLAQFKAEGHDRSVVCQRGLWKYSRHPNYFFEWVAWIAFAIIALPAPFGPLGILAPVLILYFLVYKTGIKISEESALKSKGDAYREYQRTTSPLIPWFPKQNS